MSFIKVTTFAGGIYHLESSEGVYKIRDAKVAFMKDAILGKRVAEPKIGQPLTLYLNISDTLTSSIVAEIEEYLND